MIITISGMPGSGKTSVGKIIAEKFNMPFYSVGDLRGKMAIQRGMTLDELNKLGETDDSTDVTIDEYQKQLGKDEKNFVIEGRLSWHFIPNSYKVFLDCDPQTAAERLIKSKHERPDEKLDNNLEMVKKTIEARVASDMKRYKQYYDIDYQDPSHYDLIIDTAPLKSAQQTAELIIPAIQARLDV